MSANDNYFANQTVFDELKNHSQSKIVINL